MQHALDSVSVCGVVASEIDDCFLRLKRESAKSKWRVLYGVWVRFLASVTLPVAVVLDLVDVTCVLLWIAIARVSNETLKTYCTERLVLCALVLVMWPFALIAPDIVSQHFLTQKKQPPWHTHSNGRLYAVPQNETYEPVSLAQLQRAIRRARVLHQTVSIVGAGYSQGLQTVPTQARQIRVCMRHCKTIVIDVARKTATVGAGALWTEVQDAADSHGLAVRVQQASAIFSVGGSISVNCHGWDHTAGTISETIVSLVVVGDDAKARRILPHHFSFRRVVGGYGLHGVIYQATLQLADNTALRIENTSVAPRDYVTYFRQNVLTQRACRLHSYKLSIVPGRLFDEGLAVRYITVDNGGNGGGDSRSTALSTPNAMRRTLKRELARGLLIERIAIHAARRFAWVRALVWWVLRRNALADRSVRTRNEWMRPPILATLSDARSHADWLQEYFVPGSHLETFLTFLKCRLQTSNVCVLNATVRVVRRDRQTELAYARRDCFAIVLFFSQCLDDISVQRTREWTRAVCDFLATIGGTFYLPYMQLATKTEFLNCYPRTIAIVSSASDDAALFHSGFRQQYLSTLKPPHNCTS
jgi:FAD/FMN-containing dehydrogenase